MRNFRINLLSTVTALFLVVAVFLTSLEILTCIAGDFWFSHEFEKYSVLEDVRGKLTMNEACDVMSDIMDYMLGDSDSLDIKYVRDGRVTDFLTDDTKEHLTDCRFITDKLKVVRGASLAGFVILAGLAKRREMKEKRRGATEGARGAGSDRERAEVRGGEAGKKRAGAGGDLRVWGLGYAFGAVVAAAAVISVASGGSFDVAFTGFHELFFNNDLWLLDPNADDLINLLPAGFFSDTLAVSIAITVVVSVLIWLLVWVIGQGKETYNCSEIQKI